MERQQSSSDFKEQFTIETPEIYNAQPYVRSSGIKVAISCPEKYYYQYLSGEYEESDSKALRFGRLMHMALLEPIRTRNRIRVAPICDKRTKDGKQLYQEFTDSLTPEAIVMEPKEADKALGMIARLLKDADVPNIFSKGIAERSGYFVDTETGLQCMFRPDYLVEYTDVIDIYDYKTARDASYQGFQRQIHSLGYEVSAAHYMAGAQKLTGKRVCFHWVAQEPEPPYVASIFTATKELIDIGEYKRRKGLTAIAVCTKENKWPGYTNGPMNMAPAKWAEWQQMENEENDLNGTE